MNQFEIGEIREQGRTLNDARGKALARAGRALTGDYTPEIFAYREYAYLLWREPSGYFSAIICAPTALTWPSNSTGSTWSRS